MKFFTFFIGLQVLLILLKSSFSHAELEWKHVAWKSGINVVAIEESLKQSIIINAMDMREYLVSNKKKASFSKKVYLATLSNGMRAVFKPEKRLHEAFGEVAAYHASTWLGLNVVPPTVIKKFEGTYGSLQLFIESSMDLLKTAQRTEAWSLVSDKEKSDMNVFRYIMGLSDIHNGNQLIAVHNNQGKLALVDNGSIIHATQVRYGDFAFIKSLERTQPTGEDSNKPFPFENPKTLSLPTTLDHMQEELPGFPITQQIIDTWNAYPFKSRLYVVWHDILWVQWHCEPHKPNFTNHYYRSTLESFKKLTKEKLKEFFGKAIHAHASFCTEEFFDAILERRDEVLHHAYNNPESIIHD